MFRKLFAGAPALALELDSHDCSDVVLVLNDRQWNKFVWTYALYKVGYGLPVGWYTCPCRGSLFYLTTIGCHLISADLSF